MNIMTLCITVLQSEHDNNGKALLSEIINLISP